MAREAMQDRRELVLKNGRCPGCKIGGLTVSNRFLQTHHRVHLLENRSPTQLLRCIEEASRGLWKHIYVTKELVWIINTGAMSTQPELRPVYAWRGCVGLVWYSI